MSTSRPLVIIDGRVLGKPSGGFGRYVTLMLESLVAAAEMGSITEYDFRVLVDESVPEGWRWLGKRAIPLRDPFLSPKEIWSVPQALRREGAALYHSPTFSSLPTSLMPCPWISTVHDLNHLTYGGLREKLYYRLLLRPFLRKAAAVLAVSEFSRAALRDWLGTSTTSPTIGLAENALSEVWLQEVEAAVQNQTGVVSAVLARFGLRKGEYFFSLTNPKVHKNSALLISAYGKYREQNAREGEAWPLVLTVPPSTGETEPGVIRVGGLSSLDAGILLKESAALFFPSLYEGFGLPPIEAAALGVAMAVSDIAPHREVLRDLKPYEALWISPTDFHGWTQAFHRVRRGEVVPPAVASAQKLRARYARDRLGVTMHAVYRKELGFTE